MSFLIPLSLYIHFPWCIAKCPYCDFNSYAIDKNNIPNINYIKHLLADLDNDIPLINDRKIRTIFIGGGTPNLLHADDIKTLINGIMNRIYLDNNIEITIEINPVQKNLEEFKIYQKIGINRISIGVQSFCIHNLQNLGRLHTPEDSMNIIKYIKNLNIKNINLDLMYGLPGQSIENALNDLKQAIALNPSHISWYQLTIEPNTFFYKKPPTLPDDNIMWSIFKKGHKFLLSSGYIQYEVSSYAKSSQFYCKHNINYWNFGDYIGIGSGSHSKITNKNYIIMRMEKTRHPNMFMQGKYLHKSYQITDFDKQLEFFINRFRLNKPIKISEFTFYTGLSEKIISSKIAKCIKKKYITENNNEWHITNKGKLFLNNLLDIFV